MKRFFAFAIVLVACVTAFAAQPRAEYPRPQFERSEWINLNGEWTYELDLVNTGFDRKLFNSQGFGDKMPEGFEGFGDKMPEGFEGEMPTRPAGDMPFAPGSNGPSRPAGEGSTEFYMNDMVNYFSGITAA